MAINYYSYLKGIMCQVIFNESEQFIPVVFEHGSDLYVQEGYEKYPIQRQLAFSDKCKICKRIVPTNLKNTHVCVEDTVDHPVCKECGEFVNHRHTYDMFESLPRSYKPLKFESARYFMKNILGTDFYVVKLEGQIKLTGARLDAPIVTIINGVYNYNLSVKYCLLKIDDFLNFSIHCVLPENSISYHNFPRGNYLTTGPLKPRTERKSDWIINNGIYHNLVTGEVKRITITHYFSYNYKLDKIQSDIFHEAILQAGDDDGADPSEKPSNVIDVSVPVIDSSINVVVSHDIVTPAPESSSDQAIDRHTETAGKDSSRSTIEVLEPEGNVVEAIVLDVDAVSSHAMDFVPYIDLPRFAACYRKANESVNEDVRTYSLRFNYRTERIMEMYHYFHSKILLRIIAKPPLQQAQRFWVAVNPKIEGNPLSYNEPNRLVGYDWNPSEKNEVYVVVDFSSLDLAIGTNVYTDALPDIIITERTPLITETGLPAPLSITVLAAPLDMRLGVPKPVSSAVNGIEYNYALRSTISGVGNVNCNFTAASLMVFESISVTTAATVQVDDGLKTTTVLQTDGVQALLSYYEGDGSANKIHYTLGSTDNAVVLVLSTNPFTINNQPAMQVPVIYFKKFNSKDFTITNATTLFVTPQITAFSEFKVTLGSNAIIDMFPTLSSIQFDKLTVTSTNNFSSSVRTPWYAVSTSNFSLNNIDLALNFRKYKILATENTYYVAFNLTGTGTYTSDLNHFLYGVVNYMKLANPASYLKNQAGPMYQNSDEKLCLNIWRLETTYSYSWNIEQGDALRIILFYDAPFVIAGRTAVSTGYLYREAINFNAQQQIEMTRFTSFNVSPQLELNYPSGVDFPNVTNNGIEFGNIQAGDLQQPASAGPKFSGSNGGFIHFLSYEPINARITPTVFKGKLQAFGIKFYIQRQQDHSRYHIIDRNGVSFTRSGFQELLNTQKGMELPLEIRHLFLNSAEIDEHLLRWLLTCAFYSCREEIEEDEWHEWLYGLEHPKGMFYLDVEHYERFKDRVIGPAIGMNGLVEIQSPLTSGLLQVLGLENWDECATAKKFYGTTAGHSARVDNQWGYLNVYSIADESSTISFDIFTPKDEGAYFDLYRHLMFTKMPKLKFTIASNIMSNALLRVTQKISDAKLSLDEIFQLPGDMWEIKSGALIVQPYWNDKHPSKFVDLSNAAQTYFQIDVINGTVGTTFSIAVYYNCADVKYIHYIGDYTTGVLQSDKIQLPRCITHPKECDNKDSSKCSHTQNRRNEKKEEKERSSKRSEGQLQSGSIEAGENMGTSDSDGAPPLIESVRWNLVDFFNVKQNVSFINVPVTPALFGIWPYWNAARFGKWRGALRLKIMVSNSKNLNGIFHVFHHSSDTVQTYDLKQLIQTVGNIPHTVNGAFGEAIDIELRWRRTQPYLPTTIGNFHNGYLGIAIPVTSTTDTEIQHAITIHSDVSQIEYCLPKGMITAEGQYQTPIYKFYTIDGGVLEQGGKIIPRINRTGRGRILGNCN